MKSKFAMHKVVLTLLFGLVTFGRASDLSAGGKDLSLRIQSRGSSYLPGEPVSLKLHLINNTADPVLLSSGADVSRGSMSLFIAQEGGAYKEYVGPQWGTKDISNATVTVAPGSSFETEATILFNHRVEDAHLSPMYRSQSRIESSYALGRPGKYRIKARLYLPERNEQVESSPVELAVVEPQGDDLIVWNELKRDSTYGYFIQSADMAAHPHSQKAQRIVDKLNQLALAHPNSRYTPHILRSVAKFKAHVADLERKGIVKER